MRLIDLHGQRFTRLIVIGRRDGKWECRCDCGGTTLAPGSGLRKGDYKSCGCLSNENKAAFGPSVTKHQLDRRSPEYIAWQGMRNRCNYPKSKAYKNYGGRGIKVCERWNDYAAFLADMGPRPTPEHSLERRNNNGNYEPSNCYWATKLEQVNNTRANRMVTFRGETKSISKWAREIGLQPSTLYCRIVKYGWPLERAMQSTFGRSRWH